MGWLEALVLGIVQGLTEFYPSPPALISRSSVSSSEARIPGRRSRQSPSSVPRAP